MKLWRRSFPATLAVFTLLQAQAPEPLCGLPAISSHDPQDAIVLRKAGVPPPNRTFLIRQTYDSQTLIEVEFYLLHTDSAFDIYGEVAEVDGGRVDSVAVSQLVVSFRDETAPGSIDPQLGIQAIAESVFGPPPDIFHNGKVFILLIDVRDDYVPDSSTTFYAGYFDPLDQRLQGNQADIIYLDTNPGKLTGPDITLALTTLAHEYQHLIHYGRDNREELWVNEGLSELAPTLMGLPHREFSAYLADTNVRLDGFAGEIADYARCGLFFLYAWVQQGTQFIRDVIGNTQTGIAGLDQVLMAYRQPSLDDFVLNWHRANYIQGEGAEGYGQQFAIPRPVLHDVITSFPEDNIQRDVLRLGAHWMLITGGRNLYLRASRSGNEPVLTLIKDDDRSELPAPLLTSTGFQDSSFGSAYGGLLVLATTTSAVQGSAPFELFVDAEGGFHEFTLSYDGELPTDEMLFIFLGNDTQAGEAAASFAIDPENARLTTLQFMAGSSDTVTVRLYRQFLTPSSVVYDTTIAAPLPRVWTTHRLPTAQFSASSTVYLGLSSAKNSLGYNEYLATSHSQFRPPGGTLFSPLKQFQVDGEDLTGNWSLRLSYALPDTTTTRLVIPFLVGNFYPNPFTGVPAARLDFSPGWAVELILYNILGQEVRRFVRAGDSQAPLFWDGRMQNGLPAPSGVYLGRSVAGAQAVTRKIVLLR